MNNNLKMAVLIIFGVIVLYIFQIKYSDHNLKRTVSACMYAQKKVSKSFDAEETRKHCEEKIKKSVKIKD
jgi:hypothetical protein